MLQSMHAGPIVSIMGSIVPWMSHQISPSSLEERKVAVSVMTQALVHQILDQGLLPIVSIYVPSASTKWHSLLQGGAISQDQYDEMKDTIMEDMKSMK